MCLLQNLRLTNGEVEGGFGSAGTAYLMSLATTTTSAPSL